MAGAASRAMSFSIGDVAQITRIPEDTLRMWERRYHFPQPMRSSGGQRQYVERQVLDLMWVKMQLDQGTRAGQAIQARHTVARDGAIERVLHQSMPPCPKADSLLIEVRSPLLEALLVCDSGKAATILAVASERHPVDLLVLDVVGPTLAAIGEAWSVGEVSVAVEHFASNFLRHQLLNWLRASPAHFSVDPVVLTCAPEELHEGGLLMLWVLLRQLRWPVVYLGQSLPLGDLPAFVDNVRPALVVFVAMTETSALALAEWPRWLSQPDRARPPIVGYGGRAFVANPHLAERIPGVLLGSTLCEGKERIHRLMLNLAVLGQ
jgi:MerR family transcriptional regulator, light-induced transcriptional regulator